MSNNFLKKSTSRKIFDICNYVFMVLFMLIMIYPFYQQLILSLNEGLDAQRGGLYLYPRKFTLESYSWIFSNSDLLGGFLVSILRTVVGTVLGVFCSAMLGYLVSLKNFSGKRFLRILYLITMYFGAGFIPYYLLMNQLNLIETFTVYWITGLFNAYYMLLVYSYIQNLPNALIEAAWIDGASVFVIFYKIVIPIIKPVLAAIAVFTAVGHWNSWFDNLIYNPSGKWDTLQIILYRMIVEADIAKRMNIEAAMLMKFKNMTSETIKAATTMIVTLPIVMVYPFFQKYFIGGITIGAVKE